MTYVATRSTISRIADAWTPQDARPLQRLDITPGVLCMAVNSHISPGYHTSPHLPFATGAKNFPPAYSPVGIRGTLLDGISPRCLICWLRGTGFSTYVLPFVETSARLNLPLLFFHSSCLEAAAATLQGPFVLPSSPQLISPWMTQRPRSGYIDVPGVPVDIAVECSSAVGRFPDFGSNSTRLAARIR